MAKYFYSTLKAAIAIGLAFWIVDNHYLPWEAAYTGQGKILATLAIAALFALGVKIFESVIYGIAVAIVIAASSYYISQADKDCQRLLKYIKNAVGVYAPTKSIGAFYAYNDALVTLVTTSDNKFEFYAKYGVWFVEGDYNLIFLLIPKKDMTKEDVEFGIASLYQAPFYLTVHIVHDDGSRPSPRFNGSFTNGKSSVSSLNDDYYLVTFIAGK